MERLRALDSGTLSVPRGTTDRPKQDPTPPSPVGELVEGELVSAETALPPKQAQQEAARTGKLDGDGGSGGGIPGVAWGLLGALSLLGLGALTETRNLLP